MKVKTNIKAGSRGRGKPEDNGFDAQPHK